MDMCTIAADDDARFGVETTSTSTDKCRHSDAKVSEWFATGENEATIKLKCTSIFHVV